ncbi:MAG: protein tyrosine phosphatase [Frankiales bacterium]|nr:protein tyrosine phosphatase [Frankiales bacterium]
MKQLLAEHGLAERVAVDSAGTGDWHVGQDMDRRSRASLVTGRYSPLVHRARQFQPGNFGHRDLVIALDSGHQRHLLELAAAAPDPRAATESIRLLRSFDPIAVQAGELDVPDPYYDEADGFRTVLVQIERACTGLIAEIRTRLGRPANR